ncbi:MAG: RluA family pseudouridine synthase, partial [Clostridiales bacterium]
MIRIFRYRITTQNLPASLGSFLTAQGYSRSMILGFKHHGGVTVNGKLRRIIDPLQSGDLVEIHAQDTTGSLQPNPDLDLPILYEDQDLLLLNKPDNMLIHPAGLGFDDAVGNFFAARYPNTTFRPIGRLDRHTSGISLIAKNRLTAAQLTAMPPHKCYYAIAEGQIQTQTGRIEAPLLRLPGSQISHTVDSAGKPSITNFRVLAQNETHTLL